MIDKAYHSLKQNFKVRQQGYVGWVSKPKELIWKTFLLLSDKVATAWAPVRYCGVGCSSSSVEAVSARHPELSEADRSTELFLSLSSYSFLVIDPQGRIVHNVFCGLLYWHLMVSKLLYGN